MNLDRGLAAQRKTRPVFLDLKTADIVIIWEHPEIVGSDENAWWMGQVMALKAQHETPKHRA